MLAGTALFIILIDYHNKFDHFVAATGKWLVPRYGVKMQRALESVLTVCLSLLAASFFSIHYFAHQQQQHLD